MIYKNINAFIPSISDVYYNKINDKVHLLIIVIIFKTLVNNSYYTIQ
jgi:hypothetical protein